MEKPTKKIALSNIVLDENIYPRERIDHKRVGIFAENIRDNFIFDLIEVQPHPEKPAYWIASTDGALIRPQGS